MSKINLFCILLIVILNLNFVKLSEIHFYHKSDLETIAYKARFYEVNAGTKFDNKMEAPVVIGKPEDGCGPMKSRPEEKPEDQDFKYFVLINRSNKCGLDEKAKNAIAGGFRGVILHNSVDLDEPDNLKLELNESMKTDGSLLKIPIVLITNEAAKDIKELYTYEKDHIAYFIKSNETDVSSSNILYYLVFGAAVVIIALVAIFLVARSPSVKK